MNNPLQGGRMRPTRRRGARLMRALLLLLVPAAAVAAWLLVGEGRTSDPPTAAVNAPALPEASTRPPQRGTAPAPPPGISLIGAKPVRLKFRDPPRAGVAFDL